MKRISIKHSVIAIMAIVMVSCGGGGGTKQQQAANKKYLYDGLAIVTVKLGENKYQTYFDQQMWVYPEDGNLNKRISVNINNDYVISIENIGNMSDLNNETKFSSEFNSGNVGYSQMIGFYCSEEAKGAITFDDGRVLNIRVRANTPLDTQNNEIAGALMKVASVEGVLVITKKSDPNFKKTLQLGEPVELSENNEISF